MKNNIESHIYDNVSPALLPRFLGISLYMSTIFFRVTIIFSPFFHVSFHIIAPSLTTQLQHLQKRLPQGLPRRLHLKPGSSYSHGSTLEIESEDIPKLIGSMGLVRIFTYYMDGWFVVHVGKYTLYIEESYGKGNYIVFQASIFNAMLVSGRVTISN